MPLYISSVLLSLQILHGVATSLKLPPFAQTLSQGMTGDPLRVPVPPSVRNMGDIRHFTPRKRHLKLKRLMRRMGKDLDPFWMSVEMPDDLMDTHVERYLDSSLTKEFRSLNLTGLLHQLHDGIANTNRTKDNRSHANSNGTGGRGAGGTVLEDNLMALVQSWLVQQASCPIYFKWDDLGLLYWPRWVRRGMCSEEQNPLSISSSSSSSSSKKQYSCSWPPGMHCVPAKSKRLKILRWQCSTSKAPSNFRRFREAGMKKTLRGLSSAKKHVTKRDDFHSKSSSTRSNDFALSSNVTLRDILWLAPPLAADTPSHVTTTTATTATRLQDSSINDSGRSSFIHADEFFSVENKEDFKTLDTDDFYVEDIYEDEWPSDVAEDPLSDSTVRRSEHAQDSHTTRQRRGAGHDDTTKSRSRATWKQMRKKLKVKCRWIKIPYPVTDDCYCSC